MIRAQTEHGLPVITNGEFRNEHYMQSFADVSGFRTGPGAPIAVSTQIATAARTGGATPMRQTVRLAVDQRMGLVGNRPRAELDFAQAHSTLPVEATLLDPDGTAQRFDAQTTPVEVHADESAFLDDVVRSHE